MNVKKIQSGKYEVTKNGVVYTLQFNDHESNTKGAERWNIYVDGDHWVGCGSTKKQCVFAIKYN